MEYPDFNNDPLFQDIQYLYKYHNTSVAITQKKPLWVYNNYCDIEGIKNQYFIVEKIPFDFIETGVVDSKYIGIIDSFIKEHYSIASFKIPYYWKADNYTMDILFCQFTDIKTNENEELISKLIPLSNHLDGYPDLVSLVKKRLKSIDKNKISHFLDYHLHECKEDAIVFLVHAIDITNGLWSNSMENLERKRLFKMWVKDITKYLSINMPDELVETYKHKFWVDDNEESLQTFTMYVNTFFEQKPSTRKDQVLKEEFIDNDLADKMALIYFLNKYNFLNLNKLHQDNTKKATILNFLIGKSYNRIRQQLTKMLKYDYEPSEKSLTNILPILELIGNKSMLEEANMILKTFK